MKVGFVADIHVGNHKVKGGLFKNGMNERCWLVIKTLELAVKTAGKAGCTKFVVLGDLYDTTKPIPQMISAVQDALTCGMDVFILLGNHELVSAAQGDHALISMHGYENIEVVDETWVEPETDILLVPFQPGPASLWAPGEIGSVFDAERVDAGDAPLLCLHLGLRDGTEAAFMAKTEDSIVGKTLAKVCNDFGIKKVIAGNWHFHKRWFEEGVQLIQCGTLCPTGWDNPGLEGHGVLAIYDTAQETFAFEEIPGPRFLKATGVKQGRSMMSKMEQLREAGFSPHLRWSVGKDDLTACLENLTPEELAPVMLTADGVDRKVAAAGAALAARSAKTLDAALDGFIESMELEEGVDRAVVLNRCREYLSTR